MAKEKTNTGSRLLHKDAKKKGMSDKSKRTGEFDFMSTMMSGKSGLGETFGLIEATRKGISYTNYKKILEKYFFLSDWAKMLHINERTLQRYKQNKKKLDIRQSEKFLGVIIVLKEGINVFGDKEKFISWLNTLNLALGNTKPKDLLDTNFGINLVKDELKRIEYGIFA